MKTITDIFSNIYDRNLWDYGSGPGSLPELTVEYRELIKNVIQNNQIKTVLDYGCGDWQFSRLIDWNNLIEHYTGADVVPSLIDHHSKTFSSNKINFKLVDDSFKWEPVDLIICKDVLQHLPNTVIADILSNMRSSSKFILLTNDINGPKGSLTLNKDCKPGDWRTLDFSIEPWNIQCEKLLTWNVKNRVKQTILIRNF